MNDNLVAERLVLVTN